MANRVAQSSERRNPGAPLDLSRLRTLRVNRSAVERRAATIPTRRTVKREWQAAWLIRAVQCLDLTTLAGDDTPGTVRRLAAKARHPVRTEILTGLGVDPAQMHVGAVCVDFCARARISSIAARPTTTSAPSLRSGREWPTHPEPKMKGR